MLARSRRRSAPTRTRCGRRCGPGTRPWACGARPCGSKSANDMQRSSRLQSTNCTSAPARIAASGVAMNVLDGHSTVSPCTPAKCSAASAPPAQLEVATAGSLVPAPPRPPRSGSSCRPSDQRLESSTSSISACRRAGRGGRTRSQSARSRRDSVSSEAEAVVMNLGGGVRYGRGSLGRRALRRRHPIPAGCASSQVAMRAWRASQTGRTVPSSCEIER